ncbi:hypothetical protein EV426DRAFT_718462 [Tirmania nivea]|nr:hypothetical protein EV426DRAFT_718462 [Tirmania nivea]
MSAIFCCTHPRSYSPPSELGTTALPLRSLSPSYGRQKTTRPGPGRRHSRQDIEAFYREGKRLQEVEESRDNTSETSCPVPMGSMHDGMSEGRTELLNRGVISSSVSGKVQELEERNSSTPINRSEKMTAPPIRASSIHKNPTSNVNTDLMKLASQMPPSSPQTPTVKLFYPLRTCNGEASASMKEATLQFSHPAATITNQIEQLMVQRPSYGYEAKGNGSIKLRSMANGDEDVENLEIEEVSILYSNSKALNLNKDTSLDINPPISENCCAQSSTLSKMRINELVGRSDSSLSIDRDQTPIATVWNTEESSEVSTVPLSSLAGRDKTREYLDSSSSYYTSNTSSFRSSIDLAISPMPPISDGIIARMTGSRVLSPVSTSVILSQKEVPIVSIDNFPHREIEGSLNSTYELKTDDDRKTDQRYLEVGLAFNHEKGVMSEGDSSSSTVPQTGEISKIKNHGLSVWGARSTRRPLLTEASKNFILVGDKKWDNGNDEFDKRSKVSMHKKSHSNGVITKDITNWLDEQHIIRLSPMSEKKSRSMIFKKTFTKGVSKLRNRLSSNLRPTGTLPLTGDIRHTATDGRGEFSRLHTPTESVTTDQTTIIGEYINVAIEDVSLNSEQVMANITFTPSLPTELRLDGSLEDYDDFQTAELIVQEKTTSSSPSNLAPTVGSFTGVQNAATAAVNQNRYSAIYDDCVIFPYSGDGDESGNEEESKSVSSLAMTCTFPDC